MFAWILCLSSFLVFVEWIIDLIKIEWCEIVSEICIFLELKREKGRKLKDGVYKLAFCGELFTKTHEKGLFCQEWLWIDQEVARHFCKVARLGKYQICEQIKS